MSWMETSLRVSPPLRSVLVVPLTTLPLPLLTFLNVWQKSDVILRLLLSLDIKNRYSRMTHLFITISQSGETADTLEALKMAKRAGLKIFKYL